MGSDLDIFIGGRIRRRRRLMGMTQQQLALACGVCFQQVQKYECGATGLSVGKLWKLSRTLKVDIGYFFAGFAEAPQAANAPTDPEPPARLTA